MAKCRIRGFRGIAHAERVRPVGHLASLGKGAAVAAVDAIRLWPPARLAVGRRSRYLLWPSMLDFLRRSATSVFAWIILGALALAFGLSFGLPSDSLSFGAEKAIKVHGESVGVPEFGYQYNLAVQWGLIPRNVEQRQAKAANEEVLEGIIERVVMAHEAEELGLGATEYQAESLVLEGNVLLFGYTLNRLDKDGNFNYDVFKNNFLRSLAVAEPRYLEYQQQEYLARTLRDLVRAGAPVSEPQLRKIYDEANNTISLRYARYEALRFGETFDPTQAELDEYVEANRDTLRASFTSQASRFSKVGKQMRVWVIQGKDRAALLGAKAQIDGGADFRTVARAVSSHSASRRGGDMGWIGVNLGTGLGTEVDEAAKALEEGAVSDVIETESGELYLVRVSGRREGDVAEEDALQQLAEEAMRDERGKSLAREAAQADLAAVRGGALPGDVFGPKPTPIEDIKLPGEDEGGDGWDELDGEDGEDGGDAKDGDDTGDAKDGDAKDGDDADDPEDGDTEPDELDVPEVELPRLRVELRQTGPKSRANPPQELIGIPEVLDKAWADESGDALMDQVFEVGNDFMLVGVVQRNQTTDDDYKKARVQLYDGLAWKKGFDVTSAWAQRLCLEAKAKGDLVVSEAKAATLLTYTSSDGSQPAAPAYSVCERVGSRGGELGRLMRGLESPAQ